MRRGRGGTHVTGRVCAVGAILLAALVGVTLLPAAAIYGQSSGPSVMLLDVDGPIGPATAEYIEQGLAKAAAQKSALVVIRMDTPGGLDTSMRAIIKAVIASPVPIATFVPSGGRAASAGTYILFASHVAAMAPGTNVGAATPVQIGGGGGEQSFPIPGMDRFKKKEDAKPDISKKHPGMKEKIVNDSVAYIRSLARLHGRNPDWAEKAVTEAASLAAKDALAQHVIDLIADDIDDLLAKVDGRKVTVQGKTRIITTKSATVVPVMPDWRAKFLSIITNPNVAYILLMIGVYGLIFEFYSPGLIFPGVAGGICLVLGLYALQLLPINYAGLALTILGLSLIVAETFVPSFGALGIGGVVAFILGSVILLDTDMPGFGISLPLIVAIAGTTSGIMLLTVLYLARSRRRAVVSGPEEMVGSTGTVVSWSGEDGNVRIHGERWRAKAREPLVSGQDVKVIRLDGLTLIVEPLDDRRE